MEQARTHPVLLAAGVAVLLFSLLGVAALTGLLPNAMTKPGEPVAVAQNGSSAHPGVATPGKPSPSRGLFAAPCPTCGVIDSIQQVTVKGKTSGLGAVAGGVAGGLLGNQFGRGAARSVWTVGGAAGGAFAGDAIEGQVKKQTAWRVTVRLEDGSLKTLSQSSQPPFMVGDRVRIVNGTSMERT